MADPYRPSGYDRNRRGSSPGRQPGNDLFIPNRPVQPTRSFSNMDPAQRNPAPDPRAAKRHASQSPSGAQPRKQPKHDTQQNGTTTQPVGSARPPPPASTIRKSSTAAAATASSPRSPRDSITSGRSTPQQRLSALAKETTAEEPRNGTFTLGSDSNVESQAFMALLSKFTAEGSCRADLEREMKQAEARSLNAQNDYNEMKKHFAQFPSIQERSSAEKDTAQKALLAKEKLLNDYTSSQNSTIGALASLLGQLATPKPNPDMVPRAEHDSLQKDFIALKQEMTAIRELRKDLDGVKATAEEAMSRGAKIGTLQLKVDLMNRENAAVANWKQSIDTRLSGVENIDERVKSIDMRSNATQKDLNNFKSHETIRFATKHQIDDLTFTVQGFSRILEASSLKIEALQKAQAKATADGLNSQALAKNQRLLEEQSTLKQELVDLQTLGSDLKAKVESSDATRETTTRTINQLEVDIVDCKDALSVLRDSIEEAGKEAIVKRVKRLDVLVNNLSSNIGENSNASIHQRLSQLENDFSAIREGVRSIKTSNQPHTTMNKSSIGAVMDLTLLETRLSKVEKEVSSLESQRNEIDAEKDNILESHVDSVAASLKEQFSNDLADQRSAARDDAQILISDSLEKITNGYQGLEKSIKDLQAVVSSKADFAPMEALKAAMASMSGDVKKLQTEANHQRAKSTSQPPTPTTAGPQVNGTPQLPNGIPGSPFAMQPGHGHGSTQQAPIPSQTQAICDMQTQINGLVAVTQQLKMRCDNLQTDDIVRSMMNQFSTMYPQAHNINDALQNLTSGLSAAQKQLTALQQQKTPASEPPSDEVKQATAKAEGASNTAHNVFQQVQRVWGEVNTIREAVKSLEQEAAKKPDSTQKSAGSDSGLRGEVTAMRKDLDKAAEVAAAADRLSRGHATRLSKIVPETLQTRISTLNSRVDAIEEEMGDHAETLRQGGEATKEVRKEALDAKTMAVQVTKKYGAFTYRVEKLEGKQEGKHTE